MSFDIATRRVHLACEDTFNLITSCGKFTDFRFRIAGNMDENSAENNSLRVSGLPEANQPIAASALLNDIKLTVIGLS